MSATPTKSSKRGRKKDGGCNDRCRFCSCSFENSGTRASFENLFSKSARKDSPGTVLADCCSSMGFPLIKSQSVSERVCRSCGRKIRNASELYRFIQTAVTCSNDSATGNETEESDLQECSSKRELPTTVTPNRQKGKRRPGNPDEESTERGNSRKSLQFSEDSAAAESEKTDGAVLSQDTISDVPAGDVLTCHLNIDDLAESTGKQVKVLILNPNGEVFVRSTFDVWTKSLISNLALRNWKTAANIAFKHREMRAHNLEAVRMALSTEFKELSKRDTILKGRKPEEIAAFSNKIFIHELSVFCPLWHSCLRGVCGITKSNSEKKFPKAINVMALASASLGRFRNPQLSAYAYRISTILFHAGAKHDDVLRLNHFGVCMSPQSAVALQKQMGENFDAKILNWKKSIEQTMAAVDMLEAVKIEQVPAREDDDMDITTEIQFDENAVRSNCRVKFDETVYGICNNLLDNVKQRLNYTSLNSEVLEETIAVLRGQELPSYKIVGDNVDHMIYARVQSKDSTNQSIHWTHQYAVLDKVKNNLADPREPQKRISKIQPVELLPVQDVQNRLKNRWTVLVSRVICKYLKTFKNFQDVVVHHIPHPYTDVMSEKSSSCCLGLQFKNPNVAAEMAQIIMHNQEKYVPSELKADDQREVVHPVPLHGDQLFEERARNTQWTFRDGLTEYDRLEGILPEVADWHAKVNLYELEYAMFVDNSSVAEVGTSRASMNRTGKSNATKGVHNHYNEYKEFHQREIEGHICASFMVMLGMTKPDDVPSIDIPSSKEDKSLRRKWLMDLCSKYIDKFVVNTHEVTVLVEQTRELHKASQQPFKCREPYCQQTYVYHSGRVKHEIDAHGLRAESSTEERDSFGYFKCRANCGYVFSTKATRNRHERQTHPGQNETVTADICDEGPTHDYLYNYHRGKLAFGLILIEFNDAIKEGDGDRLFDLYKLALLFYKAGGHHKYAYVVLLYIVKVVALLSKSEACQLKLNRFFNKHGGIGRNIPFDLELEHRNKVVKGVWRGLGANLTENSAQRLARCSELLELLMTSVDVDCTLSRGSKQRAQGRPEDAVQQITSDLMDKEVFVFKGGRDGHPSFPKFPSNLLHKLDYRDLHKWLSDLLKKWESIYEHNE